MKLGKNYLFLLFAFGSIILLFLFVSLRFRKKMEKKTLSVRRPAVAGMFYPQEKEELKREIEGFFKEAEIVPWKGNLKILIAPHAGYRYSGPVAGWGFAQLKKDYSTVILVGPTHQVYFEGAVIDENDVWETPLGEVPVDKDLAQEIVSQVEGVSFSSEFHLGEHCLEVELPFLQSVLSSFKIVPILLGETDDQFLKNLADFLSQKIGEKTLVVISTDLSHYPPYEIANLVDRLTIDAILSGDPEKFEATISAQMKKGYPNLATCACGEKAVKVGMMIAQNFKGEWKLIKYANSGDTAGEKGRVVGYAAIGYWVKNDKSQMTNAKLNEQQQQKLLKLARETLERYLGKREIPKFEIEDPQLNQKLGAFVTLRKNGSLRGCIGQIQPSTDPLWKVVQKMAIESALNDPRFPPVRREELKDIKIEISVLSKPKKIDDPYKIQLGKHGVIIKKGLRSGVFLPQVATETGWDLETFMGQLCSQKAGLSWDCWKKKGVEIYIFTAQVFEED